MHQDDDELLRKAAGGDDEAFASFNRRHRGLVVAYLRPRVSEPVESSGPVEPDKLATYEKLTAAINRAKDNGDMAALREIAEDPHGFILRQGWARPVR